MPYVFSLTNYNPYHHFEINLKTERCFYTNPQTRNRCNRNVCIGLDLCWQHLEKVQHLKIKPSEIEYAGKGLYAYNKTLQPNAIVFNKGDFICRYYGEILTKRQLDERYPGDITAPYVATINDNKFIDDAGERYVASLINHADENRANADWNRVRLNNRTYLNIVAVKNIRNGREITIPYFYNDNLHPYQFNDEGVNYSTKYKAQRRR